MSFEHKENKKIIAEKQSIQYENNYVWNGMEGIMRR